MTKLISSKIARLALIVFCAGWIGCGGGSGGSASGQNARAFYKAPAHIDQYANGQLIRSTAVSINDLSESLSANLAMARRIMYRSQDTAGNPIAVTGLVLVPKGLPPAGGWQVIAWAHGTVGVGEACAPSKSSNLFFDEYGDFVAKFLERGYLVVAPDYQGLGIIGQLHAYLEMDSEANSVIDGVRATRALIAEAGSRWMVVGHSQGGQAALGTGELSEQRAPELEFLGVVSIAPGTSLLKALAHVAETPDFYDMLGFVATSIKVSDPSFDYSALLGADLLASIKTIQTACANIPFGPLKDVIKSDYASNPIIQAFATRNQPGQRVTARPILLVTGGSDKLIPVAAVDQLAQSLQEIGDNLVYQVFADADHDSILEEGYSTIEAWVADRFSESSH